MISFEKKHLSIQKVVASVTRERDREEAQEEEEEQKKYRKRDRLDGSFVRDIFTFKKPSETLKYIFSLLPIHSANRTNPRRLLRYMSSSYCSNCHGGREER